MRPAQNSLQVQARDDATGQGVCSPGADAPVRIGWPWDLQEWVAAEQLVTWLQAEIDSLDWQHPQLPTRLRTGPADRPQELLMVLSYAYLTGVYAAEDIIDRWYNDHTVRQLCRAHPPTAAALRAFRRANRALIRWCLEQILKRILRLRFGLSQDLLPPAWRRCVADTARCRLELARYLDRFEHAF